MDATVLANAIDVISRVLVHSLWQGAVVGLFYAGAMLCLARRAPRVRYAAAVTSLGLFALCPLVTFIVVIASGSHGASVSTLVSGLLPAAGFGVDTVAAYSPLLVSLWLAGVALLGTRLVWNWRRAARLTYLGCQPMGTSWERCLQGLAQQMGVHRAVSLVESALVPVPTVIGWLKPVILIPSSAILGLTQRQLELVIAHELAHISRYDYVVNYFLLAVETLCFYHPIVYLIGRGIRHERELCCDDLVVQRCGGRVDYVTALTDLETLRSSHVLTEPLSNLSATGGDLLHRVRHIVKGSAPRSNAVHVVTMTAAVTVLTGCALLAGQRDVVRVVAKAKTTVATPHLARAAQSLAPVAPVREHREPALVTQFSPARARAATAFTPPPAHATRGVETTLTTAVINDALTTHPALPRPALDQGALQASLELADALRWRQREGPTHAMISELDLAPPVLGSLSDLQRDASLALAVAQSPYVVVAPAVDMDFVVLDVGERAAARVEGGALIKRIEPRYPSRARMRGYTDTVRVDFLVTDTGEVSDIHVVSSNSRAAFERAVIRAVKKWRYEPLLRDGIPVERRMVETFAFRLSGPGPVDRGVDCSRDRNNRFACTPRGLSRTL